jgi:hypothetical protein
MTEQEWLECTDPRPMVEFLRGKASDRKLRLFAVACCRRIWHLINDQRSRIAVEIAESYVDGLATEAKVSTAREDADNVVDEQCYDLELPNNVDAAIAASNVVSTGTRELEQPVEIAYWTASHTQSALVAHIRDSERVPLKQLEGTVQSNMARCIFGNPFHPVSINPAWLAWNHGTVQKIAQGIYDERALDRMPILADALEESGCTDIDILAHCRQPGEHVRGCWVVDLILGKE